MGKCNQPNDDRRGVSAVEFAVILPVVVTLIFGMIELGRTLHVHHQIHEAARAGARLYSAWGNSETEIRDMVDAAMADSGIASSDYTVTLDPSDPNTVEDLLTEVSVTVSVDFDDIGWLAGNWFMAGRTLEARATLPYDPADAEYTGGDDDDDDDDDDDGGDDSSDDGGDDSSDDSGGDDGGGWWPPW